MVESNQIQGVADDKAISCT